MNHATRSLCISCALVALALGCGKDNPVKPIIQPGPPRYHTPSAPESTVLNYALAWEQRDSTMIDSVLTDDYVGTSVDMTDPSPSTLAFTRSDEVRALGGIQIDPYVTSVGVDLLSGSWQRTSDPGDPPDWVTISVLRPRIYVSQADAADYQSTGSLLEFKVKPITPAGGAGTTWKIIRWSEVHHL